MGQLAPEEKEASAQKWLSGEVCAQVCASHKHHNAEKGSPNSEALTLFPLLASRQVMSCVTKI